ncbi:MAG: hypothetical protein ACPLKX_00555 [Dictyoglomaceae bacterium]
MKKKILFLSILLIFILNLSFAENFGVGIIIGEPTGLSFRVWQNKINALDFGLAWNIGQINLLHLYGDYVYYNYSIFKIKTGSLPFYYGIGGRILIGNEVKFGVRIPLGIVYIPPKMPLDFFLELVPILEVIPSTKFDLSGALGVRYYF